MNTESLAKLTSCMCLASEKTIKWRLKQKKQYCKVADLEFELKNEEEIDEQLGFYKFLTITVAVYFESIIVYRSTRRACSLSEKEYPCSGVLSHYIC